MSHSNIHPGAQRDIQQGTALAPHRGPIDYIDFEEEHLPTSIFLTGATGAVGSHLLKELLARGEDCPRVYCLVWSADLSTARERIRKNIAAFDRPLSMSPTFDDQVVPVLGHLTQPGFGLGEEILDDLAHRISLTIHAGGMGNLFADPRTLIENNLAGTRNAIDFALKTGFKAYAHISSHAVIGDQFFNPDVFFREHDFDIGQKFWKLPYAKAKFEEERLIRASTSAGLRWNIFRTGQIIGDSRSGALPLAEQQKPPIHVDMIKTFIETRVFIESEIQFDFTPIDYISQAVLAATASGNGSFETFHLFSPTSPTTSQMGRILRDLGYDLSPLDARDYIRLLTEIEPLYSSRALRALRVWLEATGHDFTRSARFDSKFTENRMAEWGLRCPPVDQRSFSQMIQWGLDNGIFEFSATQPAPVRAGLTLASDLETRWDHDNSEYGSSLAMD